MKKPVRILLDLDNVVLDTDNCYDEYVRGVVPDFSEERYILEWNMPQLERVFPEAFNIIKGLWENLKFMGSLPLVKNGELALERLRDLEKSGIIKVTMYTCVSNEEVAAARRDQFSEIFKKIGHEFELKQHIGLDKPPMNDFDIIIEDSTYNLSRSKVPNKVIIRRGNNRFTKAQDLGEYERVYFVMDLYTFVNSNYFCDLIRSLGVELCDRGCSTLDNYIYTSECSRHKGSGVYGL